MTNELDIWLFNHAQLMGNQCDGIKDETGTNFAWQDTVTKEVFVIGMHELQTKVEALEERISAETDEAYQDGYQAALKEDDEAAITLEVRKMDKEQKMKELLEGLYVDFQMLEEGTWIPDEHSIEASKDAIEEIADMLNMPMERSE